MSEWIAVAERLPELRKVAHGWLSKPLLVCRGRRIEIASWGKIEGGEPHWFTTQIAEPTHWRALPPLPEPPK